ncbi:hypothetical protein Poly21_45080 [Allorhodopirellula heiligendammensis]|uniref:Uncharacterized protein n=1 Tax=Allorhodopirellula heiligendammensis TaxID=2714739 RepID=A0A5C6BFZ4_9BACT|nr:hypothetical protein Poly21_45080 [Allorhodopirellula heiligendammensis]
MKAHGKKEKRWPGNCSANVNSSLTQGTQWPTDLLKLRGLA